MTIQGIMFDGFNRKNTNARYFIELNGNTYVFELQWLSRSKTAFLNIKDYNDTPIISGRALVNNLKIRNNKLPYVFYFLHKNGETYEPTIDDFATDFVLAYDDGEEE